MISNTNIRSKAWNNLKQDIGVAVGAIILFFIVTKMNAVCLFSIKDEIKSKSSDNKVYVIDN